MFEKNQIKKLQQIHKEVTGKEIGKEEAIENGVELVDIHKRIIKINNRVLGEKNGNLQTN